MSLGKGKFADAQNEVDDAIVNTESGHMPDIVTEEASIDSRQNSNELLPPSRL